MLLCTSATSYYLTPSIGKLGNRPNVVDLEERISFIEAEGGEHFSMKNFGDKNTYDTKIPGIITNIASNNNCIS